MNIDISTVICGIKINNCINNASGAHCQTEQELTDLDNAVSGYITTKTCTFKMVRW